MLVDSELNILLYKSEEQEEGSGKGERFFLHLKNSTKQITELPPDWGSLDLDLNG